MNTPKASILVSTEYSMERKPGPFRKTISQEWDREDKDEVHELLPKNK